MRWEVFKQDAPGKPHQAVGSVHGADAEHALLNARHVFGRRPSAASVWVVNADSIYSRTAEELSSGGAPGAVGERSPTGTRTFHVFRKASHRRSMTFVDHVLDVESEDHAAALAAALSQAEGEPALAWWVVAAEDVTRSEPGDAPSWFEPARDKTYKQQSAYGTVKPRPEKSGAK